MIEGRHRSGEDLLAADFVPFSSVGEPAHGEYRCAECGYGITLRTTLPRCPMCGGASWEPRVWGTAGDRS